MNQFEELEKYVIKLKNNSNDNCCLICYLGNEKECLKINCGHYFHLDCLNDLKFCPYCNKKIKKKFNKNICKVILKTGKRKGLECGRNNCGYHKNNIINL